MKTRGDAHLNSTPLEAALEMNIEQSMTYTEDQMQKEKTKFINSKKSSTRNRNSINNTFDKNDSSRMIKTYQDNGRGKPPRHAQNISTYNE